MAMKKKAAARKKTAAPRARTAPKKKAGRKAARVAKPARRKVQPVPAGYHTVTPHLIIDDCARAIEFYKQAFGAKEKLRMPAGPDKIAHAEIKIGDSVVMMSDEMPPMPGESRHHKSPKTAGVCTGGIFLYVKDVDATFQRAVAAGCTVEMPPSDMFWGDRYGKLTDPFGHTWAMGTHKEDLTPAQMRKRQQEFMAQMSQQAGGGQ